MTPQEMIRSLSIVGDIHECDYHDGMEGYFGWDFGFENGDLVLTIRFEDHGDVGWETSGQNNEMPSYESKWVLTRKGN